MTEQPDNGFSDISEAEQRARDAAVSRANTRAGALDIVISTRARQLADDKPPPDRQRGLDATRDARTRLLWAEWHRDRCLTGDRLAATEADLARLAGGAIPNA